jgi:adenylyltransferase/sulfurtransferase
MTQSNPHDRYQRQRLLPQFGAMGQQKLSESKLLLVGCGALGCTIAELLVRAGIGFLRIVDRDLVELTNLQRQILFDETDAKEELPKAIAAANRLAKINSSVRVEPIVADVNPINIQALARISESWPDLILDGTDNVATRYLLNDFAIQQKIPWIYGACVGVEGRIMGVWPQKTACLRCLYPTPPPAEQLPACDTAGVLGAAAVATASMQVAIAMRFLVEGSPADEDSALVTFNAWNGRFRSLHSAAHPQPDCPCCQLREFPFLSTAGADFTIKLCGQSAVQVAAGGKRADLPAMANRLGPVGIVRLNPFFLRCKLHDPSGIDLTLFPDGRLLVHGTTDPMRAKSIYARFIGT